MRAVELGDHPRDQRVGEEGRAAEPDGATLAAAEGVRGLTAASRGEADGVALLGERAAERRRLQRSAVAEHDAAGQGAPRAPTASG